ncbi:MAG: tetratricopeptide repeat protein [bacterium]|nr:tetratricopeptide repeat protein [bacterium]
MQRSTKLDAAAFIVLQLTLLLAPIFFVPALSVPFMVGKSALMVYGVLAALVLWIVARLRDGQFEAPKSLWYASAGVLAVVYAASSIFSANHAASFMGQSFEIGTLAFFLLSLVVFALVPLVTKTKEQIFYSYGAVFASFFVLALFHVVRLIFGADALSFDIFTSATSSLIGKWNDLAIFLGLIALVSMVSLEKASLSGAVKWVARIAFVLSLVLMVVVDFRHAWILLAVISLIFTIYEMSFGRIEKSASGRMPLYALAALIVSLVLIFSGGRLTTELSSAMGTSQVEVRPSWSATWDVAKATLSTDPVLGVGPNRYGQSWLLNKPVGINTTIFWNTEFNYGIGFVPSLLTTTGVVGLLAMLAFLCLYLWTAVKALFRQGSSPFSRYLVLSSLLGSLYLWVFSVIYVPSAPIWLLTFAFSGLFIAALREDGALKFASVSVSEKPALNFISVLVIIFVLIGSASFAYTAATKTISNVYLQRGAIALAAGDIDTGESRVISAFNLSQSDTAARYISQIYLARLNMLYNDETVSQADAQSRFQQYLSSAIQAGQAAVAIDQNSYVNHATLGSIFESVVPLNIEGAYDSAKQSYEVAIMRNPQSPELQLLLARLEVANGDNGAAREFIGKALELKGDYAEAAYLLSQIQIGEKNVPEAIRSLEAVAILSPSDSGVFFQLGLLYYDQKRYSEAVLAFGRAVQINPQYANAKYFLGLALYETKDVQGAIKQFEELSVTNADNAEVKAIIANLKAGRSPLAGIPQDGGLPVNEPRASDDR